MSGDQTSTKTQAQGSSGAPKAQSGLRIDVLLLKLETCTITFDEAATGGMWSWVIAYSE